MAGEIRELPRIRLRQSCHQPEHVDCPNPSARSGPRSGPQRAADSPFQHHSSPPSGLGKGFADIGYLNRGAVHGQILSRESKFSFGVVVQGPPEPPIDGDHKQTLVAIQAQSGENCRTERPRYRHQARALAAGHLPIRDFARRWRRSTSPRGGDRPGHVIGKDTGDRNFPPPQPAAHTEIACDAAQFVRHAEAPAMTLKRMYHCVPRIISVLRHTFASSCQVRCVHRYGKSKFAGNAAMN